MGIRVLFKICEKGEAYPHFEQLKPYLQSKEYLAVKLTKKSQTLLKNFLRDGNLSSEMIRDFKSFEVVDVDFSNLEYRDYTEIEHSGFFGVKSYLNLKESVIQLQKFLEDNSVGLMPFQEIIHACGLASHTKAIEICQCSPVMLNYYFKPLKQSFQTQVINENFVPTSKGLGQAEFIWVNGAAERSEMLMPFYMGDSSEDFNKSSRVFVKARQVIFIFVTKASEHFPSVSLPKETGYLPESPLHPLTWRKIFSSRDPNNFLHDIADPLPEWSLQQIFPAPKNPLISELLLERTSSQTSSQTLFEELDQILPDLSSAENEQNMNYFEDLWQTTNQDPFIFELDDVCLTCFHPRGQACHCHETSCELCFAL